MAVTETDPIGGVIPLPPPLPDPPPPTIVAGGASRDAQVLLTMVGGRIVHEAPGLEG